MKRLLIGLLMATAAFAQTAPGMYLDRDGNRDKMDHATLSGMESKGIAKSMFVPGASVGTVWDFPGRTARLQAGATPRFIYQVSPNQILQDLVMVRMDQKSDRRQIKVAKASTLTGSVRVGFNPKSMIELRIKRTENTFEIVPAQPLAAGEYFITAGFSSLGYDFSVSK
jgi:hypothetical protein